MNKDKTEKGTQANRNDNERINKSQTCREPQVSYGHQASNSVGISHTNKQGEKIRTDFVFLD